MPCIRLLVLSLPQCRRLGRAFVVVRMQDFPIYSVTVDGHCARSNVYVILNTRVKKHAKLTARFTRQKMLCSSSNEPFVLQLVFITEHMTSGSLLHFLLKAKRPAAGKTSVSDKVCGYSFYTPCSRCSLVFFLLLWHTFHVQSC